MSRWLLTRPLRDSRAVEAELQARGHRAVIAPVMEVVFPDIPPLDFDGVQALLFTSQNGVRAFAALHERRDLRALAVGHATAEAAASAGFARVESAGGDAAALAGLARSSLAPNGGTLLHIAGTKVAGDLGGALERAGFTVRRAVLYEARPVDHLPEIAIAALEGRKVAGALFFSPRTAEVFARLVAGAGLNPMLRGLAALCLSKAVAERLGDGTRGGAEGRTMGGTWGAVRIAARPELPALLALLDTVDAPTAGHQTQA
jgi:uroporphyrinogen-III synthase